MDSPLQVFRRAERPVEIEDPAVYLLVFDIDSDVLVEVGRLGRIHLMKGRYAYCGSAGSGLGRRVRRYTGIPEKRWWHIDRLLPHMGRREVFWREYAPGRECGSARTLSESYPGIRGFGCSDCPCDSHLFKIG